MKKKYYRPIEITSLRREKEAEKNRKSRLSAERKKEWRKEGGGKQKSLSR